MSVAVVGLMLLWILMVGRVSVSVVGNGETKFVATVGAPVFGSVVVGTTVGRNDKSSKGDAVAEKVMVDDGIDEGGVVDDDKPTQNSWSIGTTSSFINIEFANQCQIYQSDDKNTLFRQLTKMTHPTDFPSSSFVAFAQPSSCSTRGAPNVQTI